MQCLSHNTWLQPQVWPDTIQHLEQPCDCSFTMMHLQ